MSSTLLARILGRISEAGVALPREVIEAVAVATLQSLGDLNGYELAEAILRSFPDDPR